jgi:SlyX protein
MDDQSTPEERITALETRVLDLETWNTHLETANADLSDMVSQQWAQIDRLTRTVELLHRRIAGLEPEIQAHKPPHY